MLSVFLLLSVELHSSWEPSPLTGVEPGPKAVGARSPDDRAAGASPSARGLYSGGVLDSAPGELRGCYLAAPERAGQGPEVSAAGRGVGGLGDKAQ